MDRPPASPELWPPLKARGGGNSGFLIFHAVPKSVAGMSGVHFSAPVSRRVSLGEAIEMPRAERGCPIFVAQHPEQIPKNLPHGVR